MPRNLPAAHEPGVLEELAAAYARGLSIRELAYARGWSYGATHRRLQVAAAQELVTMRPRGARRTAMQSG